MSSSDTNEGPIKLWRRTRSGGGKESKVLLKKILWRPSSSTSKLPSDVVENQQHRDDDSSSATEQQQQDTSNHDVIETRTFTSPFMLVAPAASHSWDESTTTAAASQQQQQQSFAQRQRDLLTQPPQQFLSSFRDHGMEFISAAYLMTHPIRTSITSHSLSTALPEDVFALVEAQITVLGEYINHHEREKSYDTDKVMMDGISIILHTLQQKHVQFRELLLDSLQACIAYANDCLRMVQKVDDLLVRITTTYAHLDWDADPEPQSQSSNMLPTYLLKEKASHLVALYGKDAVYASQCAASFIIQSLQRQNISEQLFSREWEDVWVHQEVARNMVRCFGSNLDSIETWLDHEYLYHKVVVALVRNTVSFYCLNLIRKAEKIRRSKRKLRLPGKAGVQRSSKHCFNSASRAILRMSYDLETFQEFFNSISQESTALTRAVSEELFVMGLIIECMGSALGEGAAMEEFVVVVHKRTGADSDVTRHFLKDIWILTSKSSPSITQHQQQKIDHAVKTMKAELEIISSRVNEKKAERGGMNDHDTAGRLDEVLRKAYEDKILQEKTSVCGGFLPDGEESKHGKAGKEERQKVKLWKASGSQHPDSQVQDLGQFFEKLRGTLKFEHFRKFLVDPEQKMAARRDAMN